MKWKSIKIETVPSAEDLITAALYDEGFMNIEIRDSLVPEDALRDGYHEELIPDIHDEGAYVIFYLDDDHDVDEIKNKTGMILNKLREDFPAVDFGTLSISVSETDETDWENEWKKYFHRFKLGSMSIVPIWEKNEDDTDDAGTIYIDPGLSFGTGSHETTRLCILAIEKYFVPGGRFLDLGFGSGILSIAAMKYGAAEAFGTDIDPLCNETAFDNFRMNNLDPGHFHPFSGDIASDSNLRDRIGTGFDMCCGNLLADIIIPMAPFVPDMLRPGGIFISSGILKERAGDVMKAFDGRLDFIEKKDMGDWTSLVYKRPED